MSDSTDPRFPVPDSGANHPLDEVIASAQDIIDKGGAVLQKFTCSGCGARQTMDKPNKFYTSGSCGECGHITDIAKDGCNFIAIIPQTSAGKASLQQILDKVNSGEMPL